MRDIDPRDLGVAALDGPLAVRVLALPVEAAGDEDELVVGPDRGLGVADDLDHAEAAAGLLQRRGRVLGGSLERREGVRRQVGGLVRRDPEGHDVDVAPELPRRRHGRDGLGIGAGGAGRHGFRSGREGVGRGEREGEERKGVRDGGDGLAYITPGRCVYMCCVYIYEVVDIWPAKKKARGRGLTAEDQRWCPDSGIEPAYTGPAYSNPHGKPPRQARSSEGLEMDGAHRRIVCQDKISREAEGVLEPRPN